VIHEQAAGFALDALDGDEARDFEGHLPLCPGCEDELEPLRLAAVALAFAGELPAPRSELRRRVLAVDRIVLPFRRRALPYVSAAAVATACAAVAVVLLASSGDPATPLVAAHAYPLRGADGALLVAPSGEAVLIVRRLPAAPAGKSYEVWVVRSGRATAAGMLRGSMVELAAPLAPGAGIAVTVELAAGSPRPTGPFLLRAETA
jgi:anti-sigma-K factor RskA